MVEANTATLRFYRTTCRLMPAVINRNGTHFITDVHTSKLNIARWIRRGKKMENLADIEMALLRAYEMLFECVYSQLEVAHFFRYVNEQPATVNY